MVVWTMEEEHKIPEFQNQLQQLFLSGFTGAFVCDLPVISCVSWCVFVTDRVGGILLTRSRRESTNNVKLEREALERCHHTS